MGPRFRLALRRPLATAMLLPPGLPVLKLVLPAGFPRLAFRLQLLDLKGRLLDPGGFRDECQKLFKCY